MEGELLIDKDCKKNDTWNNCLKPTQGIAENHPGWINFEVKEQVQKTKGLQCYGFKLHDGRPPI